MPAKSNKQRRFFFAVKAYKNGDKSSEDVSKEIRQAAASMSKKQIKDFTDTKGKLPEQSEDKEQ